MEQEYIWFSEQEGDDTTLTREDLVKEIKRITDLTAPATDKILEIRYLIKRYFKIDEKEGVAQATQAS